ncbi:MAG: acyltransferase [Acidimicrobiales bacterium]|jgi:peptidoglycan/LPS O-acetylase OafA/YrhL
MATGPEVDSSASQPSRTIQHEFDPKHNSLGFLRMVFAVMVLIDHSFPLGGFHGGTDPMWGWTNGQESLGGLAVAGFFVVSGYLVTKSFFDSNTAVRYTWKRVLRIFPGFWVCLLVTVVVFAPIAYHYEFHTLNGYLKGGAESPWNYLKNNALLTMHQYNIDGLLSSTPYEHSGYPQAFDGSLWTLIYEFKCYIGVALIGTLGLMWRARISVVAISLVFWVAQLQDTLHPSRLHGWPLIGDPNMARLAFIFSIGMLFYLYRDKIPMSNTLAGIAAAVFVIGMRTGLYAGVGQVAWAYLVLWLAIRLPLKTFDRFGDFSYGLYIYAFPIEQLLALYGVQRWGYGPYVALALAISLVFAVASWFLIEKPFLGLKRLRLGEVPSSQVDGELVGLRRLWNPRWGSSGRTTEPSSPSTRSGVRTRRHLGSPSETDRRDEAIS